MVVFQDLFSKWPAVYPVPDQKAVRLARLLVDEIISMFGVPEKLNTTVYHPQCDGMVERFNRTLKIMLRKRAACFGNQWDQYLSGVLWAYRNTPHDSTGEKPSFLLFWLDCRSPTEAALLPTHPLEPTDISDYREELMLSLSSARDLAAKSIHRAQRKYKTQYDRKTTQHKYRIGVWVLVRFPNEESGKQRKLS